MKVLLLFFACFLGFGRVAESQESENTHEQAKLALQKAVHFFHSEVSSHGGYLWRYSSDLVLREGEGQASKTMIWVQPPGTPTVGQAFLEAYEATGELCYLDAARDAAYALLQGQLHSGGWFYRIEFDAQERQKYLYRYDIEWHRQPDPTAPADPMSADGWDVWKKRRYKGNLTILDDDTTQSAARFLMRVDQTLDFKDQKIHEASEYALESLLKTQYPNGAWSASYDRFPRSLPNPEYYPVIKASYPQSWPRTWTKEFSGCYMLNDNVVANMILVMLDAYEIYGDERYLASAQKAGDFLLLAQMPEPQPAWAQQYDRKMYPVWDRKFEPPAISSMESQAILEALMLLYRKTGKAKYLEPIPRAIGYLRGSQLPDGSLARFYELQANRPLYFTKDYKLTYSSDDLPTHYSFIVESRLDSIEAEYHRLSKTTPPNLQTQGSKKTQQLSPALIAQVRTIIDSMDKRGAWVERGQLRHYKSEPQSGIINCQTFVNNVKILCQFITVNK